MNRAQSILLFAGVIRRARGILQRAVLSREVMADHSDRKSRVRPESLQGNPNDRQIKCKVFIPFPRQEGRMVSNCRRIRCTRGQRSGTGIGSAGTRGGTAARERTNAETGTTASEVK
jgi:hypothetical protein